MILSSVQNPRVKAAARLRERSGRDEQGRIIIDGVREISRALAAGVELLEVYFCAGLCSGEEHERVLKEAEQSRTELIEVTPHVAGKLSFGQRAEGIVAVARPPERGLGDLELTGDALVAIIEGVE